MHSIETRAEYANKGIGEHGPTGRHVASATMIVSVRDFALLNAVRGVLTSRDEANVHTVNWSVDDDNPEWALVRADAIHAALLKGQDYASALGGSIVAAAGGEGGLHGALRALHHLSRFPSGQADKVVQVDGETLLAVQSSERFVHVPTLR